MITINIIFGNIILVIIIIIISIRIIIDIIIISLLSSSLSVLHTVVRFQNQYPLDPLPWLP